MEKYALNKIRFLEHTYLENQGWQRHCLNGIRGWVPYTYSSGEYCIAILWATQHAHRAKWRHSCHSHRFTFTNFKGVVMNVLFTEVKCSIKNILRPWDLWWQILTKCVPWSNINYDGHPNLVNMASYINFVVTVAVFVLKAFASTYFVTCSMRMSL